MSTDLKSNEMAKAFENEFGISIETVWNVAAGSHITYRKGEKDFSEEQIAWLKGWDAGRSSK